MFSFKFNVFPYFIFSQFDADVLTKLVSIRVSHCFLYNTLQKGLCPCMERQCKFRSLSGWDDLDVACTVHAHLAVNVLPHHDYPVALTPGRNIQACAFASQPYAASGCSLIMHCTQAIFYSPAQLMYICVCFTDVTSVPDV